MIKLNTDFVNGKINDQKISSKYQVKVNKILKNIVNKNAKGCEMLGWIDNVNDYSIQEIMKMKKKASEWRSKNIKHVLVIGIGGSYIGIRAALDMCGKKKNGIDITFVANISASNVEEITEKIKTKNFAIVVISKSGTTLEPAVAFRHFRKLLEKKMGANEANKYVVCITDNDNGILLDLAKAKNYTTFSIPNNIGGRFSTLTPVGLFAMILYGLNPIEILRGARLAIKNTTNGSLANNSAYLYACYRNYMLTHKKLAVENFIVYEPCLYGLVEQYKQLFGESEGKEGKALMPTGSLYTTDLHAMGQYFQEGSKIFFETTLLVRKSNRDFKLNIKDDEDGLKYLNGKSFDFINNIAANATIEAHSSEGKIDNILIEMDKKDENNYGYFFIWMAKAAMMSAYLLNLNPFDQPGVEAYKKRMNRELRKA